MTPPRKSSKLSRAPLGVLLVAGLMVFSLFSGLPFGDQVKAANFSMKVGYYVGNGSSQSFSNFGFQPDMVIIKSDQSTGGGIGVFKTSAMPANTTAYFSATAVDTNTMVTLDADGFSVSSVVNVNGSNVRYTYTAFGGSDCTSSGTFCVDSYTGNGINPRLINTGFQPAAAFVKRSTAVAANFVTKDMPTNVGQYFTNAAQNTTGQLFATIAATGFNVGASINNVNAGTYYFAAFKEVSGVMQTGTYTGDGVNNRSITGFGGGATPDIVIVRNATSTTANNRSPVMSQIYSYGDQASSIGVNTVVTAGAIQGLESGGFKVGTSGRANQNSQTHYWLAWAGSAPLPPGSGSFEMAVGTYIGDGTTSNSITGLGFKPDLVMIKRDNTNQPVLMRVGTMQANISSGLATTTASLTNGITSLDSDGFTVGNNVIVNTNGQEYHWQAFGGAYSAVTGTGSADFMIGAYTGNGVDNRLVPEAKDYDLVTIKQHRGTSSTQLAGWRTTANSGDATNYFSNTALAANLVQDMTSAGFELGTGSVVNTNTQIYFWFAFKKSRTFDVGSYTGSGGAQNISTGFQPDLVWVKRNTNQRGVLRPSTVTGNSTQYFTTTANFVNGITALISSGFSLTGTTATTNASGGTYYYAAWRKIVPELAVDIVDSGGASIASPVISMTPATSSNSCITSTGTLGAASQKIRIYNTTVNPNWAVSIAPTIGAGALWTASGSKYYDFNDEMGMPVGCVDGDSDGYGGQLGFSPSGATIAPGSGCTNSGLTLSSSGKFSSLDSSLSLITGSSAGTDCFWDLTGIGISQTIPGQTPSGSYQLGLTVTIVAN